MQANAENFLDFVALDDGVLAVRLYNGAVDLFEGQCQSETQAITQNTWVNISFTANFNGVDTVIIIYVDGTSTKSFTAQRVYIEDKAAYPNSWLFLSSASVEGTKSPSSVWNGFIYWFTVHQAVLTEELADSIELDPTACAPSGG